MRLFFASLLLISTLTFCSNEKDYNNPQTIEQEFNDNLRGTYLVKVKMEQDTTKSENEWEQMGKDLGNAMMNLFQFNLTFEDNNVVITEGFGTKAKGYWEMKGNKLILKSDEQPEPKAYHITTFDGNFNTFLVHTGDSTKQEGFIFTKVGTNE